MTRQTAKPDAGAASEDASTVASSGGGANDERSATTVSQDAIFDALKNSRRRLALQYLYDRGDPEPVNDLVDHVAAAENETTLAELTSDQRKRVYVGLYQSHLPRLDDMGFVEFDQDAGTVELGPAGPALDQYIGECSDDGDGGDRWYRTYLAFLAVTVIVLAGSLTAGLLTIVGAAVILLGIGTGVAGLAAYERRVEQA